MRLGVSGRAPAAGAQRGAAGPRKGCGKASAPPRSRGWFRGSPPFSRPRRPFSSPITLLRRRGRFTARGGTRTAQRRARGSLWRYRRAPPSPAPSGRSPRLCPAHNGAVGWRGGVGVEGGVWAGLPDGGKGALLPAEHRGCFCQERGGVRQNGNCFNKGREGEALKAGWWDYFRINPAPEEHLTSSSGDARWGLAVLGQSGLGDTGV